MTKLQRQSADVIGLKKKAAEIRRRNQPKPDPEQEKIRNRSNIAALVFMAVLVLVGWWLVQILGKNAAREDCLLSGRRNCEPIIVPPPPN